MHSHFVHRGILVEETIAAIATPPGDGGVAIIRVSGKEAVDITQKICAGNIRSYASHTAHLTKIIDLSGDFVDQVLVLPMLHTRSYTGENTIEIHCHGGRVVAEKILRLVLAAGARGAAPGEFTFRAFRNGKIDLAQAEAVQAVIASKNEYALIQAEKMLSGALSNKITSFQHRLLSIIAIIEAWVDFPDEDLAFASFEEIQLQIQSLRDDIQLLIRSFDDGKKLSIAHSLVLVGAPNVGKSSIMNTLCGISKSIVTHIPGTTRDIIEEDIQIAGISFRISDTAGIRDTDEVIEAEGIKRSKQAAAQADLVLYVTDVTRELDDDLPMLASIPKRKSIVIINKIDLGSSKTIPGFENVVCVSAHNGIGFESLKKMIASIIFTTPPNKEEIVITQERHRECLTNADLYLSTAAMGLRTNISPEFISIDLKQALKELGGIIGLDVTESLLDTIFSSFCIGK